MALMTMLYVFVSASALGVAVLAPATSFGFSKSGEFTNWSTPPVDGKEGRVGASQVPADGVPLGVGPHVGGYGRRIRRAVFIDLGVHYFIGIGDGSTSASGCRRRHP